MKSMTILGALVSLGFMSATAQATQEIRWFCASDTGNCGIGNTTTATNKAIEVANNSYLVVGDMVTLMAYGPASGGYAEKTRYFTVLSTPITSAANFNDSGYRVEIFDVSAPAPPSLRGSGLGGDGWWYWLPGPGYIRTCGHIPIAVCH